MATRGKAKKLNKAWLHDHLTDPYVKLAQRDGYRSRAAYKLKEIDETLGLLRGARLVVDLGAAPGAWSQYVRRVRPDARVLALDLLPVEPIDGVEVVLGDFREEPVLVELERRLGGQPVDAVVSDMAPNLSGIAAADAARMGELVELALEFAAARLAPDGALVCKVFHGSGYSQLVERFKRTFRVVKVVKPKASRAKSAETFLAGIGLKRRASVTDISA
jgi:23S rRNA (uridine2552-2'-O)-methyltransferase